MVMECAYREDNSALPTTPGIYLQSMLKYNEKQKVKAEKTAKQAAEKREKLLSDPSTTAADLLMADTAAAAAELREAGARTEMKQELRDLNQHKPFVQHGMIHMGANGAHGSRRIHTPSPAYMMSEFTGQMVLALNVACW
eukprot:gene16445-22664_t